MKTKSIKVKLANNIFNALFPEFTIVRLVIGLQNLRHSLSQSEVKPKPIVTR